MSLKNGSRRLARILMLIPFLQRNSGISVQDTAKFFSITEEQLISDLNLIWLCGLPGYSHLELIDVSYDSGVVSIQNAETLARPMRITFDEGAALLLAIENLSTLAPESDTKILYGLRKKISDLLSLSIDHPNIDASKSPPVLPELIRFLEKPSALLDVDYYSATLDDSITRTIRPVELSSINGFTYLVGFSLEENCYLNLRVDRIRRVAPSSSSETHSSNLPLREESQIGARTRESMQVEIEADVSAYWLLQKWHLDSLVLDDQAGIFRGVISVFDQRWVVRLAMSAGGSASILAPLEVRDAVAQTAERTRQRYADPLK